MTQQLIVFSNGLDALKEKGISSTMNRCVAALLVLFLASCASQSVRHGQMSLKELVSSNQAKLAHISLGISKENVVALMGTNTADTHDGIVNNPWTVEGFVDNSNARYEVLYYVTRTNQPFTPIRKSLTTPIVIKDNKVVGWGNDALERISK
jgi:hypothetical protein